jgi:hypothetical protein
LGRGDVPVKRSDVVQGLDDGVGCDVHPVRNVEHALLVKMLAPPERVVDGVHDQTAHDTVGELVGIVRVPPGVSTVNTSLSPIRPKLLSDSELVGELPTVRRDDTLIFSAASPGLTWETPGTPSIHCDPFCMIPCQSAVSVTTPRLTDRLPVVEVIGHVHPDRVPLVRLDQRSRILPIHDVHQARVTIGR